MGPTLMLEKETKALGSCFLISSESPLVEEHGPLATPGLEGSEPG